MILRTTRIFLVVMKSHQDTGDSHPPEEEKEAKKAKKDEGPESPDKEKKEKKDKKDKKDKKEKKKEKKDREKQADQACSLLFLKNRSGMSGVWQFLSLSVVSCSLRIHRFHGSIQLAWG